jgi:hypothetical protein
MATSGSQRQPSAFQNIKLFPDTQTINSALWILKNNNNDSYITPANNVNVLVKKNLIVNGSIVNPSDLLLKENIISLRENNYYNSIDSILKLNPIKYNYISDENKKQHYGFIAQDVEKYFPELISEIYIDTDERPDERPDERLIKTVNYVELIPIMLSKMQEMQNEINELKLQG